MLKRSDPQRVHQAAIACEGVCKSFRIPHEQVSSLKELFLHPGRRTTYEENQALADVTFSVQRGEFFGVIGPNGSGKSTLLKMIAGIYRPDAGFSRVLGRLSAFIELGVGFHPDLNARDNVWVNGLLVGLTEAEIAEKFDDIIAFAELDRFVDQKLRNYSSGMQVRLAYSIAIQVPFDVLLLDEVLAVGDRSFQEKCFETFEGMRAAGKTVVLVSHDLAAVNHFCDRALLLDHGTIKAIGPAQEVTQAYVAGRAEGLARHTIPAAVRFGEGWHPVEYDEEAQPFRWMQSRATLTVDAPSEPRLRWLVMDGMSFNIPRELRVRRNGTDLARIILPPQMLKEIAIELPASESAAVLELEATPGAQRASIVSPRDHRMLAVSLWNIRLDER